MASLARQGGFSPTVNQHYLDMEIGMGKETKKKKKIFILLLSVGDSTVCARACV